MADVDSVAAAKAGLEMMLLENQTLLDHFGSLIAKLEELQALPGEEKRAKLKELESSGAFQFNGVDIRRFQNAPARALPPREFLVHTRRRMDNTLTLLRELLQRKSFAEGAELATELGRIVEKTVSATDAKAVVAFRDRVETLRNSPPFLAYLDVRKAFLKADREFRGQAEFLSTQEAVAEGEQAARACGDELEQIKTDMESGKISPDDVQKALEEFPPIE